MIIFIKNDIFYQKLYFFTKNEILAKIIFFNFSKKKLCFYQKLYFTKNYTFTKNDISTKHR